MSASLKPLALPAPCCVAFASPLSGAAWGFIATFCLYRLLTNSASFVVNAIMEFGCSSTIRPFVVCRDRCVEDDFQLAAQSLAVAIGCGQGEGENKDTAGTADGDDGPEDTRNVKQGAGEHRKDRPRDGAAALLDKDPDLDNGFASEDDRKDESCSSKGPDAERKHVKYPAEHPLQTAITSFDMALGELNQLIHLVDLARAGEFMVLERVTPSEEDQARAVPDDSVSGTHLQTRRF